MQLALSVQTIVADVCIYACLHGHESLMGNLQEDVILESETSVVLPAHPDELYCSHCRHNAMVLVRLASDEQLEDWQALLCSNPDCKPTTGVQVPAE